MVCLMEKIYVFDKLCPGMSHSAVCLSSVLMNQQYLLNSMSFKTNIHKIRLCTDWLMKIW